MHEPAIEVLENLLTEMCFYFPFSTAINESK